MPPPHATDRPSDVTVRMYNVGFGDCFLLTFTYPTHRSGSGSGRTRRHMLVDFGSTQRAKPGPTMNDIASLIAEHTDHHVDVVVATHRHKDHISGFAGAETDPVMKQFAPTTIIRPWTDNPKIAADALAPSELDPDSTKFIRLLSERERWLRTLAEVPVKASTGVRRNTADLTADQLPNLRCITRLDGWSDNGRGIYVKAGDLVELDELPGVTIEILGPPTLLQVPSLASQAFTSPEFWAADAGVALLAANRRTRGDLAAAHHALAQPDGYGEARWIIDRLAKGQLELLFNVVRDFDDALNNTSIIMIVRVGTRSMLLSGDAQIENWNHTLGAIGTTTRAAKRLRSALTDIDLYKVGHHGSRNATPRSLLSLWAPGEARRAKRPPLVTMMSTLPDKHGNSEETAVPRPTLITALTTVSTLIRTDTLTPDAPFVKVTAHTTGASGFELDRD